MRSAILSVLVLVGCGNSGLPGGSDMAGLPDDDGSVPADLAGAGCGAIAASVQSWLDAHLGCSIDSDCTIVNTACGLDGQCGAIANQQAAGAYLSSLVDAWQQQMCHNQLCECPLGLPAYGCNQGVCGVKTFASGQVGDPCVDGADCTSGFCLSVPQGFPGGYCSVAQCAVPGPSICPQGSTCEPVIAGMDDCVKNCNPQIPNQCRDGYACCGGPGPVGTVGYCVPTGSSLCLEQ